MILSLALILASGVLFASLFHRLGLGSLLGYLVAGLFLGPTGLGLLAPSQQLTLLSEMGVVFLLFLIGLELEPKKLWEMRKELLRAGLAQMLLVSAIFWPSLLLLGFSPVLAGCLAVTLSLSSTALVLKILNDRGLLKSAGGQRAFTILLFQDLAILPLLLALPFLASAKQTQPLTEPQLPLWLLPLILVFIVLIHRPVLRNLFHWVATTRQKEIFTGFCLLIVVAMAGLMHEFHVSMALGAFVAGVLLATSEYKHAIETDLEPFKGLLLGLFFVTVGVGFAPDILLQQPTLIFLTVIGIIAIKAVLHWGLFRYLGQSKIELPFFAILLAQVGEFAFVVFAMMLQLGLLDPQESQVLVASTGLTLFLTPVLLFGLRFLPKPKAIPIKTLAPTIEFEKGAEALIIGFGRVGQIVGRTILAAGYRATIIDSDPDRIEFVRKFGFKIYYGDAKQLELLEKAGIHEASVVFIAIGEESTNLQLVDLIQRHFPNVQLVVRARTMDHCFELIQRGVQTFERDTFHSSLVVAKTLLEKMGQTTEQASRTVETFRSHNISTMYDLASKYKNTDQEEFISAARRAREDLTQALTKDREAFGKSSSTTLH